MPNFHISRWSLSNQIVQNSVRFRSIVVILRRQIIIIGNGKNLQVRVRTMYTYAVFLLVAEVERYRSIHLTSIRPSHQKQTRKFLKRSSFGFRNKRGREYAK